MFFERRCPLCSRPARFVCDRCWCRLRPAPPVSVDGVDRTISLYCYDDPARRLVLAAKNGGRRDLLRILGRQLAVSVGEEADPAPDVVTWVPASPELRRRRGFDQGRVLARAAGRRLGIPVRTLLTRAGAAQRGLARGERLRGPTLRLIRSSPPIVLIVDDVTTTGASLRSAAMAVRAGGAERVIGVTIASVGGAEIGGTPIYG